MTLLDSLVRLDRRALVTMRSRMHSRQAERAAIVYAAIGELGACWIALALAGARFDSGRRQRWLLTAGLVPTTISANYLIKRLSQRRRPALRGLPALGHVPSSHSFPSAHAASSFVAAWSAPAGRGPLLTAATLMSLTRPYLGLHYPSDVLAGAALGSAIGIGVARR